jgi:hypothetical protein
MNDDHGDQFPGAVPRTTPTHTSGTDRRVVRMHAAYVQKVNAAVEAGRDDLAEELATTTFADDAAEQGADLTVVHERRAAGRRTPTRGGSGRRPESATRLSRLGRITRTSLDRFDRYTLDVFNAGIPYRTDRSA